MTPAIVRRVRLVTQAGDKAPRELVGGKGFRLRELARHGMPVPPWIVLTTAATGRILAPVRRDITTMTACVDEGDLASASGLAARIAEFVRRAEWPGAVHAALAAALRTIDGARGLAVRSSAVGEDGHADSYAGVFESRLAVPVGGLESAVRDCLAAAFGERVLGYRTERRLQGAWPPFAVIIQEMAAARVAGVAFTADPRTGEPRRIIVAGYGLGSGIVDDVVETDCYERGAEDAEWTRTIRAKEQALTPDGAGGIALEAVALAERRRATLTDSDLERLSTLLTRVDDAFGGAQDIEWAIDEAGALHVLQARPIGVIPGTLAVWDDSNIGESYPGVTLPLTYSLVRRTYERLFTRALAEIGVPRSARARLEPDLRYLIGIIDGHLYMNLLGYYRMFAAAPGLGWTVARWEDALGIRDAPDPSLRPIGGGTALRRAAGAVRAWGRLLRRLHGIEAEVSRFEAGVEAMLAPFEGQDLARWPFERLLQAFEELTREHLDAWTVLIFNDLFAFLFNDRLARLCDGTPDGAASDLHQRLLTGLGGVSSVSPLHVVRVLAAEARRVPEVAQVVWSALPARDVWERLRRSGAAAEFLQHAGAFRRRYGDRSVEELKLETATLADEPWRLVDLLRSVAEPSPAARENAVEDARVRLAAEREFRARWVGRPVHRWAAAWVLRRARRLLAARENMSFARARAYGLVRRIARAMGVALVREGALVAPEDVHYATFEELAAHARAGLPGPPLRTLTAARRQEYRHYPMDHHPRRIMCRGSAYRASPPAPHAPARGASDAMHGIPCAPGRARGVARIIRGGVSPEAVRDHILVARVTEPGWLFLMAAARGVVVERGSVLSHAAIIGRELGVPTIVGVAGALGAIRDGDEVEMDGSTGELRVLHRADPCPG